MNGHYLTHQPEAREIIPAGKQRGYKHLIPVAKFLIERGHPIIDPEDKFGFVDTPGRFYCKLGRGFTDEDWAAINDHFIVPKNIVFWAGVIRDNVNRVDMMGIDRLTEGGQSIPFDEWEERERRAGRRPPDGGR